MGVSDCGASLRIMESNTRVLVDQLSPLTDLELYQRLADEVVAGSGSLNDDQRGFFGKAWFEAQSERLRDRICSSKVASSSGSTTDRVATILALIETLDGDPSIKNAPAAAAVAILVVRIGLDNYCRGRNHTEAKD